MSLAANALQISQDKVRSQLALVDGNNTPGEWQIDLLSLQTQTRAYVLEQIPPDRCPWVFATVALAELRSTVSAKKEGFVDLDIYVIVRTDNSRFQDKSCDEILLLTITDVMKTVEASPGLTELDGWLDSIRLEEKDLDPENDAWGFGRIRVRYAINGTLGQ